LDPRIEYFSGRNDVHHYSISVNFAFLVSRKNKINFEEKSIAVFESEEKYKSKKK